MDTFLWIDLPVDYISYNVQQHKLCSSKQWDLQQNFRFL